MSSTRRVQDGQRRRQNGWASASEYDVLRGINGTAVAFKAALQDSQEQRELLFFLQSLSLRDGGVKLIARDVLEMFPDRVGSPTMHKLGAKLSRKLSREDCRDIYYELNPSEWTRFSLDDDMDDLGDNGKQPPYLREPDRFVNECRALASARLPDFIEELCCDPKMEVANPDKSRSNYNSSVEVVLDDVKRMLDSDSRMAKERPDLELATDNSRRFRFATFPFFHDILGALFEFKRHYEQKALADHVETSIGKIVFEALDYVMETGSSALIEGNSGFGKTTNLKTWVAAHQGRARYVQLSGITSRGSFLRRVARACGVANGGGMSSERIQQRVEDYLRRTKLVLLIDEAQYLWPQGRRITSHPELVNWLNTSLHNEGVPFVLSATKQFTLRRQTVELQTDWSSEQSRRRTRRVFSLPDVPTSKDLEAVARKLLVGLSDAAIEFVVSYAMASRGYFQTISDTIDDAQLLARRAGRDNITGKDLQAAVKELRAPSDASLVRVFDSKPQSGRRRQTRTEPIEAPYTAPAESPAEAPLTSHSRGIKEAFNPLETPRRSTRPESVSVLTG